MFFLTKNVVLSENVIRWNANGTVTQHSQNKNPGDKLTAVETQKLRIELCLM